MSVQIHFHGAAGGVTGSCYALVTERARIIVDCGMFQGSKSEKELNYRAFPFVPANVDGVILTHAHIDHSGLLPKLTKAGFKGPIFATRATIDLCAVMLPDSAFIQEAEVEQLNRRNARRGRAEISPIYSVTDATAALTQFRAVDYARWIEIANGVRARFWNAGHLLGSASVEVELSEGANKRCGILFSGDIGPDQKLLQSNPEAPNGFDYVVCEATYGDTDRQDTSPESRRKLLRTEVQDAVKRGGPLLIPSFAVERTQELLVDLVGLMEEGQIATVPIFIDSPLATKASAVFERHSGEIEGGDALRRSLNAPNVRFTESVEQSRAIGRITSFHVIIAASGMCDAGRIRHHLRDWLWRPEASVLLVGYQAQGTLGRILQDGSARVRIMGEEVDVQACIRTLDVYSGHADGPELGNWLQARMPIRKNIFLVHGEEAALAGMQNRARALVPVDRTIIPALDDAFELDGESAHAVKGPMRRIEPSPVGRLDWHNDLSKLLLDISDTVAQAADERSRAIVIRRLRKALDPA